MRWGSVAWAILLLGASLAGCTGAPASPRAGGSSFAPPPSPGADTGSVAGFVVDEEHRAIPNATVVLMTTNQVAQSDASGAFTINGAPPGKHKVIAQALGYQAAGRELEVLAGQVARATFVLSGIMIPSVPYHRTHTRVSEIFLDQEWVGFLFILADQNHSAICGSCYHTLYPDPGVIRQVLVENSWPSFPTPVVNGAVAIWWMYYGAKGDYHNALEQYSNRESRFMPDVETNELNATQPKKISIVVESGLDTVSFQHKVTTYHTFAYGAPLKDGFTALAPAG